MHALNSLLRTLSFHLPHGLMAKAPLLSLESFELSEASLLRAILVDSQVNRLHRASV